MMDSDKAQSLWACEIAYCNYFYNPKNGDPERGVAPGTCFEDLPEDWRCPTCGVGKENFHIYEL